MTPDQDDGFDLQEGQALKESGRNLVEDNNARWVDQMRAIAIKIAKLQGSVSADDLRRYADDMNLHPAHPNAWGSVFRGSHWKQVGYIQSQYTTNHARRIIVWTLDPSKAPPLPPEPKVKLTSYRLF